MENQEMVISRHPASPGPRKGRGSLDLFVYSTRAGLNMGISKTVFPIYRNIIIFLLLLPFAYFFEKKERPPLTLSFLVQFFLLAVVGITANQGFYLLGLVYMTTE